MHGIKSTLAFCGYILRNYFLYIAQDFINEMLGPRYMYMYKQQLIEQEAHGPQRSSEKTVQINKHIRLYHND